jgi:hypothetical protein
MDPGGELTDLGCGGWAPFPLPPIPGAGGGGGRPPASPNPTAPPPARPTPSGETLGIPSNWPMPQHSIWQILGLVPIDNWCGWGPCVNNYVVGVSGNGTADSPYTLQVVVLASYLGPEAFEQLHSLEPTSHGPVRRFFIGGTLIGAGIAVQTVNLMAAGAACSTGVGCVLYAPVFLLNSYGAGTLVYSGIEYIRYGDLRHARPPHR